MRDALPAANVNDERKQHLRQELARRAIETPPPTQSEIADAQRRARTCADLINTHLASTRQSPAALAIYLGAETPLMDALLAGQFPVEIITREMFEGIAAFLQIPVDVLLSACGYQAPAQAEPPATQNYFE